MQWFKESLIDTDAKTFGVYVAILYCRFSSLTKKDYVMKNCREELFQLLSGRDLDEALKSAKIFIDLIYSYGSDEQGFLNHCELLLESIEEKYYNKFRNVCYKYLNLKALKLLTDEEKEDFKKLLRWFKKGCHSFTACGSCRNWISSKAITYIMSSLTGVSYRNLSENEKKEFSKKSNKLLQVLKESRILWFESIIPAPFLEEEFIKNLKPPLEKEVKEIEKEKIRTDDTSKRLAKEIKEISERLKILAEEIEKLGGY